MSPEFLSGEHAAEEGFVMGYGEIAKDGTISLVHYGEGNSGWQAT